MRRLLALLVVLAVSGCSADATTAKAKQSEQQDISTAPTGGVGVASPTHPYLLRARVHADGHVLPGRYDDVTVRGTTWLGVARPQEQWTWGVGSTAHRLPRGLVTARLSNNGRYLATIGPADPCFSSGKGACEVRFLDTTGAAPVRRLDLRAPQDLIGVTDDGMVLLRGNAEGQVWHAARGDSAPGPGRMAPGQPWPLSMSAWEEGSMETGGFTWTSANSEDGYGPEEHWLGDFVDDELRPRFRIPPDVEVGPGRRWVLSDAWAPHEGRRNLKGALEPTTSTLEVRPLGKQGKPGVAVPMRAPTGWFFARATPSLDVVFWEDTHTFFARVVDSRQSGDRLARCDLPLATCVLIGS